MKRKKVLPFTLFLVLSVLILTGCGGGVSEDLEDPFPERPAIFEHAKTIHAMRFSMGDTRNELAFYEEARPVHEVNFTYDFIITTNEISFDEFVKFIEDDDYKHTHHDINPQGGKKHPVTNISWLEATYYCNWVSEKMNMAPAYDDQGNLLDSNGNITTDITLVAGVRLPTEAEWEYAARGGPEDISSWGKEEHDYKYAGSNNIEDVAWYSGNSGGKTHKIGPQGSGFPVKKPNEVGLYNMSGNVMEWCHDWYGKYTDEKQNNPIGPATSTSGKVVRGGSCRTVARQCRVAYRNYYVKDYKSEYIGFRVVLSN